MTAPAQIVADRMSATDGARGFDPTDVPRADPLELERVLRIMIRSGDGLLLLQGIDATRLASIEAAFWREFAGDTAAGVAVLMRVRALIAACAARRLQSLLLHEGLPAFEAAFRVAAGLRLNPVRGFSPQGLVWAVTAAAARAGECRHVASVAPMPMREPAAPEMPAWGLQRRIGTSQAATL